MENKIVLITGAKGGLGSFVTEAFLAASATVVGTSRSISQADFKNDRFNAIPANIIQPPAANDLVQQVIQRFGRIDALVHVMGGFAAAPIHATDDATWTNMRDVNLTSAFNIFRAVLPHMRAAGRGRIVAVSSIAALQPAAGIGPYVTFKVALNALVQTVAIENRDRNITANAVLPGTMDTPANRTAMPNADPKTWINPQDVADLILSLVSDSSGQITAALIPVYPRNA
jgi:NAD(P)-dependent dehydrogenase (short-subunit alcohol dehydrogenase family)